MVSTDDIDIFMVLGISIGVVFIVYCCLIFWYLRRELKQKNKKHRKRRTTNTSLLHSMKNDKGQAYLAIGDHDTNNTQKGVSMQPVSKDKIKILSEKKSESIPEKVAIVVPKSTFPPFYDKNYHKKRRQKHLKVYRMEEVEDHDTIESCWIIVNNLVLDVTKFLKYHPAGISSIVNNGGTVCDKHFEFHSKMAKELFWKFVIGRIENNDTTCNIL